MDWIDVAIPAIAGTVCVTTPEVFLKNTPDHPADPAKVKKLRMIGYVLLAVAVLYLFLKLFSPK